MHNPRITVAFRSDKGNTQEFKAFNSITDYTEAMEELLEGKVIIQEHRLISIVYTEEVKENAGS